MSKSLRLTGERSGGTMNLHKEDEDLLVSNARLPVPFADRTAKDNHAAFVQSLAGLIAMAVLTMTVWVFTGDPEGLGWRSAMHDLCAFALGMQAPVVVYRAVKLREYGP